MNGDDTIFSSVSCEIVDGLLDGLCYGTHCHDNLFSIRCSIIFEWTVVSAGKFSELAHVTCNYVRNSIIELISGFYCLEIHVTVLCGTSGYRRLRSKNSCSEFLKRLGADHASEIVLVDCLDLLDFV